jgi:hypothetical protein
VYKLQELKTDVIDYITSLAAKKDNRIEVWNEVPYKKFPPLADEDCDFRNKVELRYLKPRVICVAVHMSLTNTLPEDMISEREAAYCMGFCTG